ncbi:MAG TPA: alkaline phosphatase family protein [Gemmatimonadaceae bacterium]|nr:alkaline phosphatase family protein [Gemmatimonadaceae bacterium]
MIRRHLALLLVVLPAVGAQAPSSTLPERPTLVVFLTVDQMREDYFQRFDKQLTGGLRRLYDGGAFFLEGYHDHAITETAPGHAAMLSGRFPVHTGIVMNNQGVNGVPDARVINGVDEIDWPASPIRFQGTTLIDWLKAAQPETRFLSVSRKDRGAILPIGRSKGHVYWWAASNGTFTTSHYYADTLPSWVQHFNARKMAQQYTGKTWDLLLPASAYPEPDTVSVENRGVNNVFPHGVPDDSMIAARSAAAYPWMDEITLQFALAGLQTLELGALPGRADVLSVSLSTTDAIGHAFGPDSRELHDQILRLDRSLGRFLDSLFKLRDQRRVVIALTGDHGMAPYPTLKSTIYPNHDAKLVSLGAEWRAFQTGLSSAGVDSTAVAIEDAGVVSVVKPGAFTKARVNADSAMESFGRDALHVPGVLRADLVTALAKSDTTRDTIARRWLHMFRPGGPARLVITLTPYSYWGTGNSVIATHGSPHDYDAHVPIVFYGAGVRPGKYKEFVRVVDMAPTLAELLGVKPLEAIDGRVLRQAIR